MCGILCEIYNTECYVTRDEELLQRIKNRGPDCYRAVKIAVNDGVTALFCGAVLWMQGPQPTPQPVEDERGVLLYNGDIFDTAWDSNKSDTIQIMEKFSKVADGSEQLMIDELKSLKGPFSLIYYNKLTHKFYFARDRIGRSTLLFHKNNNSVVISSVLGKKYKCIEIPATHICKLDVNNNKITLYPWLNDQIEEYAVQTWLETLQNQQKLPDTEFLFSFDSTVDLNDEDNLIGYIELMSQKTLCKLKMLKTLLEHDKINEAVIKITQLLQNSVKIRLETQTNKCKECLHKNGTCNHSAVGILFSGGLDCTILAFLADKYLPKEQKIDLLNVAFKKDNSNYDVPDRVTGRQSLEELKELCPSRDWVFREINVPKDVLEEFQTTTIGDLVYPRQTILDESLGSALWFAAHGQDNSLISPSRVLLLGSGADELFGGYTRHRNAYKRSGWLELSKELQLDWTRISFRNLARDNRVICDHGRQPRMPYLDEDFTEFVLKLKPWFRCFPSENLGPGVGDKLMLRLTALYLGLMHVVTLPKRALQFGSRIANKKEKGSDISKTFLDAQ